MKFDALMANESSMVVAPFTGAWIEISVSTSAETDGIQVAPFTGAWIEIDKVQCSPPTPPSVAPFTGAWIEIPQPFGHPGRWTSRTLHGCVD